ncbi:kelch repeat-containing protein [Chitinophaga sp. 22536]|uniref:AfsR/SARP family transcriptional regulator n=1 Tax=unclassified Chitinophaga TaxID=2619133 RepID=UPI003F843041
MIILISLVVAGKAQEGYGLAFASKNIAQEDRTSLDLTPEKPVQVKGSYSLSFDLSFQPFFRSYFGYVFRITDEKRQNIDLIYNVRTKAFYVVTGNSFSGITFSIGPDSLFHQWNTIRLDGNNEAHTLAVTVNGKQVGIARSPVISGSMLRICFGANYRKAFRTFDLPPMRLKDIRLFAGNRLQHHWPLDQTDGFIDKDLVTGQTAQVKNPVWMRPAFTTWHKADSFIVKGNAGIAMDAATGTIYITSNDSLYRYSCFTHQTVAQAQVPHISPQGLHAVFNPADKQLYQLMADSQQVAVCDTSRHTWDKALNPQNVTSYWHSNLFFSAYDSSVYIIGGYGDFRYKNEVHRYTPSRHQWEQVAMTGDTFTPRYLAALGHNEAGDTAYILGGYGSTTGDQLLNPHNLYDLVLFDVKRRTFRSIYRLKEPEEQFAFAGNMILNTAQQEYYALTFANDRMNSSLQLIRGSLKEPVYTAMATPVPFDFYDIRSAARLFYTPENDELTVVTLFSLKNNTTQVRIHTLLFSPYGLGAQAPADRPAPLYLVRIMIAIGVVIALFLLALGIAALNRRKATAPAPVAPPPVTATTIIIPAAAPVATGHHSGVLLFGHFTVTDKDGNDITRAFSPLLKELFLLLYLHSLPGRGGISSEEINEVLWPGRSVKDAKNNRSVNLVKLKNILDKTGAYTLAKDNERWIFRFEEPAVQTDLDHYYQLLQEGTGNISALTALLKRGPFLQGTEYPWLDKFKADIASHNIELLGHFLEENPDAAPAFVLEVCDCMLHADSLHEEAVRHKCRALVALRQHAAARHLYASFLKEYKSTYGATYEVEYAEAIAHC